MRPNDSKNSLVDDTKSDVRYLQGWNPHVTIAKTSQGNRRTKYNKGGDNKGAKFYKIMSNDYKGLETILGEVEIPIATASIDLLSMREVDDKNYYKSYCSFQLEKNKSYGTSLNGTEYYIENTMKFSCISNK